MVAAVLEVRLPDVVPVAATVEVDGFHSALSLDPMELAGQPTGGDLPPSPGAVRIEEQVAKLMVVVHCVRGSLFTPSSPPLLPGVRDCRLQLIPREGLL